jgi:hypothetical protein
MLFINFCSTFVQQNGLTRPYSVGLVRNTNFIGQVSKILLDTSPHLLDSEPLFLSEMHINFIRRAVLKFKRLKRSLAIATPVIESRRSEVPGTHLQYGFKQIITCNRTRLHKGIQCPALTRGFKPRPMTVGVLRQVLPTVYQYK